jgi:ADP-dependent NAD(P)H-hydrate dehydratase
MTRPRALTAAELKRHPLPPVEGGSKDDRGKLLIVGGSREVAGAPIITATAAMRAGAGKVTIATVASAAPGLGIAVPEARVIGFTQARDGAFARSAVAKVANLAGDYDAIIAGPGMLPTPVATHLAARLCDSGTALALDAALLHGLPPAKQAACDAEPIPILLPHGKEMASLLGCSEERTAADPLGCALEAAKRYQAFVLAKGAESHIATPGGKAWKYRGGGSGLAISGSGDALAGILGGLLARGGDPLTALLWSVWLHGESGRRLSRRLGPIGFLAREIPGEVPALLQRSAL